MQQHTENYLIFPSWADYAFTWDELPHLLPFPEKYAMRGYMASIAVPGHWVDELERCRQLGYTVTQQDQRFIDGPEGGGLIAVRAEIGRWFPKVLLTTQCDLRQPPGFCRHSEYGLFILVPRIRAAHRLGETQMPHAPSPLFSVEQIPGESDQCFFSLVFDGKDQAVQLQPPGEFPHLGLSIERLDAVPTATRTAFESIRLRGRCYSWYKVLHHGLQMRALMAALTYLGLSVASRADGSLRMMHMFCSKFLPGLSYPSAAKWTQTGKRISKATDW